MNKRPAETRDDFSKMKNLWQVNQNPEDEELDGKRRGKRLEEENSFHVFAQAQHIFKTLQAGLFQVMCSREQRSQMETAGS